MNLFGEAKSTALKCIHRVCEALVENLLQEFVTFPTFSVEFHLESRAKLKFRQEIPLTPRPPITFY